MRRTRPARAKTPRTKAPRAKVPLAKAARAKAALPAVVALLLAVLASACGGASSQPSGPAGTGIPAASHRAGPAVRATAIRPAARGGPARLPPTVHGPLDGKVVVVDPGHNGGNAAAGAIISRPVWNGRETEACDTAGTQTADGYPESLFTWRVGLELTADLRAEGASVVLTRTSDTGVGPCITRRAAIGNEAGADAAISVHADGGPPGGRGFAILVPVADGINDAIVGRSAVLGADLRAAFAAGTREPVSSYDGTNGIQPRDDLAGTNLSTVPKVFIECANMRNAADAALLTSPRWQAAAGRAMAAALTRFLLDD
jgi:N-acetylmuramoyl-L-alanine amidase